MNQSNAFYHEQQQHFSFPKSIAYYSDITYPHLPPLSEWYLPPSSKDHTKTGLSYTFFISSMSN